MNPLQTRFQLLSAAFLKPPRFLRGSTLALLRICRSSRKGLSIQSRPANDFALKAAAKKLIPSLTAREEALSAICSKSKSIAVVHLGSEGEHWFVANSFDEFCSVDGGAEKRAIPRLTATQSTSHARRTPTGTKDTKRFATFCKTRNPTVFQDSRRRHAIFA